MALVWVMVLGDLGRSPRMQYHTLSLCRTDGYDVHLIGQRGSALIPDLQKHQAAGRLAVHYVPDTPRWLQRLPGPLRLPLKAALQLLALLWMLLVALPAPRVILLQLPPALPTMLVCKLAALRHHARLVYDWHNFAYTLMAIGMGAAHPLVRLAERYERFWGRRADASLCVTRAMQHELGKHWRVPATVFHDCPPDFFRPACLAETHALLERLQPALAQPLHPADWCAAACAALAPGRTLCTEALAPAGDGGAARGAVRLRADRPALVVSSTSWTPDEDFGLLLRAAQEYDARARRSRQPYPRILFLITGVPAAPLVAPAARACAAGPRQAGVRLPSLPPRACCCAGRGPQRAAYEARMRGMDLGHVAFRTLWLEPGDYLLLLGSADLGVSLHASSSGLDLPMKARLLPRRMRLTWERVVDMFGCGLPVCTVAYPCIGELVSHEHNGLLFSTPEQLAQQLLDLFRGFGEAAEGGAEPGGRAPKQRGGGGDAARLGLLARLRAGVREGGGLPRWHDSWRRVVLPVLRGAADSPPTQ
eukprot:scaffold18.g2063.t1